ncbi:MULTISPECIES: ATP-binding cassette domain-containing protein [Cryobacterium]|uniref:ABC transporter ATP-binding protein n=1 Tax=Cryobacterium breve TaxID=1259258 RepID=UPI00141B6B5B
MFIDVENASKSFGPLIVLKDFSCTIASGRVTALVGPSGSGKSTLLAAMAGFQRLDSGTIRYRHPNGTTDLPNAQRIAWVPQGANSLGARSALDNVLLSALASGRDLTSAREIAHAQLQKVGLGDKAHVLARHLSGGELQRVGFARALAAEKPIIFADEPTSSLDAANTFQIAELLLSLREIASIVVATHDPILVEAAQDVVQVRREHGAVSA